MLKELFDYRSSFSDVQAVAHQRLAQREAWVAGSALAVFMSGQVIQYFPDDVPQFLRHHLTNCVDVVVPASALNYLFMRTFKMRSRALELSLCFMAVGAGYYEYDQWKDRLLSSDTASYDWAGSLLYVVSGMFYGLWSKGNYHGKVEREFAHK